MAPETKSCRVWIRFESKKQDGNTIKLRIQDLPPNRIDEFMTFYTSHFIKDEAFHKAAGIAKNTNAIKEYEKVIAAMFGLSPVQIVICCEDNESEDFDKIIAISTVQLRSKKNSALNAYAQMGIEFETEEMQALAKCLKVIKPKFPKSLKENYESYHDGRGIIVHPDYRGLGIATQMIKQRRLLIQEDKVPMTCAWMTSIGSQKAAERDGWETVAEVTVEDLEQFTGLFFDKIVPIFKLMVATLDR